MSDDQKEVPAASVDGNKVHESNRGDRRRDSFNVPVQKSPWAIYALLQIPIVIIMVIIVYFMYQSSQT